VPGYFQSSLRDGMMRLHSGMSWTAAALKIAPRFRRWASAGYLKGGSAAPAMSQRGLP